MEEIGLTSSLSEWELRTACFYNKECRVKGFPSMRISINLSSRQLHQKDLVATVSRVLSETGTDPDQLELEITEGDMVRNIESTSKTLKQLSGMGVQIAIDDFGKGYSSLSYLRYFPLNKIKIDKVFVDGITTDHSNAAISTAIVALARSLKLNVIAEGVEKVEQLDFLRSLNCDEVQGYLFSHPLSAEESLRLLNEKRSYDKEMPTGAAGIKNCDRFWLNRRQAGEDVYPERVSS
jgi:EAL domain-containing protein (putative c-di-GMP-specific phosphodiesterase class I)